MSSTGTIQRVALFTHLRVTARVFCICIPGRLCLLAHCRLKCRSAAAC
jgi:hypothetical protein